MWAASRVPSQVETKRALQDYAATNGAWSEGVLDAAGRIAVNKTGTTQFRVSFQTDDNDDRAADYVGYYSGNNSTAGNRPQLVVVYQ